jgi:hypothetical protein
VPRTTGPAERVPEAKREDVVMGQVLALIQSLLNVSENPRICLVFRGNQAIRCVQSRVIVLGQVEVIQMGE